MSQTFKRVLGWCGTWWILFAVFWQSSGLDYRKATWIGPVWLIGLIVVGTIAYRRRDPGDVGR